MVIVLLGVSQWRRVDKLCEGGNALGEGYLGMDCKYIGTGHYICKGRKLKLYLIPPRKAKCRLWIGSGDYIIWPLRVALCQKIGNLL